MTLTFNRTYVQALSQLVTALEKQCIDYTVEAHQFGNGFVVRFSDGSDVAIHDCTCGHESGLWESYGHVEDGGDITRCMSVNDILRRFSVGFDDPIWQDD